VQSEASPKSICLTGHGTPTTVPLGTNPSWQPLDLGPMLDEYQAGAEAGKAVPAWVKAMTKLKGER
jgi:hypothetical protein